jgi:hypothetical protein
MTKRDKQEATIRNNPRQVRFDDLDTLMRRYKFVGDRNKPHVVYAHSVHTDVIVNVAKPHGGANHVKTTYVEDALAAIDAVKARG